LAADLPNVPDYQSGLGVALSAWAQFQSNRGNRAAALDLVDEAIRHQRAALKGNPNNPDYLRLIHTAYYRRVFYCQDLGKDREREESLRQMVAILDRIRVLYPKVPRYRSEIGGALNDLARVLRRRGQLKQARQVLEQAVQHQEAALAMAPRHPGYLDWL